MKKTIALTIIAIFIFSLMPLAFAQNTATDTNAGTTPSTDVSTPTKPQVVSNVRENIREKLAERKTAAESRKEANIQRLKVLKEANKAKLQNLDAEKLDRVSNLSSERLQKIAELDKRQIERLAALDIKNLDKIADLKKERLERLAKLSEEKIQRLAELDKDKLEKISDLSEGEMNKLAVLDRARLREMTKEDLEKLRAKLKNIKVMRVKSAEDLDERNVSDANLAELRDKFEKSKENFKAAKEGLEASRKELNEAIKNKNQNKTLDSSKKFLSRTADALISHLEKIKTKVQESKNIPEDKVKTIVADIGAEIANVKQIKAEIESATTKGQIKAAAKKLQDEWNKLKNLVKLHSDRIVSARVEGIVNQGLVLEKRLDNVLAKLKEKGINVSVDAEVATFSEKISASRDEYKQAQSKISEAFDLRAKGEPAESDKIKQLLKEAEDLLKQARNSLKEAHDALKTIVKQIKEAAPDAKLSEEGEVEVAEETNATAST